MSSDDIVTRVARLPCAFGVGRATRRSDSEIVVYIEDGWIFRVKPGAPIECVRDTRGVPSSDDAHCPSGG